LDLTQPATLRDRHRVTQLRRFQPADSDQHPRKLSEGSDRKSEVCGSGTDSGVISTKQRKAEYAKLQ
jgi:hypothetical protein